MVRLRWKLQIFKCASMLAKKNLRILCILLHTELFYSPSISLQSAYLMAISQYTKECWPSFINSLFLIYILIKDFNAPWNIFKKLSSYFWTWIIKIDRMKFLKNTQLIAVLCCDDLHLSAKFFSYRLTIIEECTVKSEHHWQKM